MGTTDEGDAENCVYQPMKNPRGVVLGRNENCTNTIYKHEYHGKVKLMCLYYKKHDETEVPNPYYGGPQGFEKVTQVQEDFLFNLGP